MVSNETNKFPISRGGGISMGYKFSILTRNCVVSFKRRYHFPPPITKGKYRTDQFKYNFINQSHIFFIAIALVHALMLCSVRHTKV